MTQQTADEQTTTPNQQRYVRFQSEKYDSYVVARMEAQAMFRLLTNEAFAPEHDLTTESHKVRIKRRVRNGRESFDVICYESIEHKKKMDKAAAEESQKREGTKIISKKA